ncbi:MAG: phosphoesterase [Glaciihabitans sp.]|nr:phosphoesterase [Glaciihabitans sp.]
MSHESGKFTILHLSDVHATAGELLYGQVDGLARLKQVADYAVEAGITPEAVVVTGDLANRGHTNAYPALNAALRELGERVGAPVLTVLGNHDCPEKSRQLDGHTLGHTRVVHVGPVRFVLLDSSTGALDAPQLEWLSESVAEPFGIGTVLALHHAPVPSPLPTLAKLGLRNAAALADAITGSDVRMMLSGHYHHPMAAMFGAVPVFVGPSLAYHQVMNAGPDLVSGHDHAMFSLVHLTAHGVSAAPVGLLATDPLFSISAARPARSEPTTTVTPSSTQPVEP